MRRNGCPSVPEWLPRCARNTCPGAAGTDAQVRPEYAPTRAPRARDSNTTTQPPRSEGVCGGGMLATTSRLIHHHHARADAAAGQSSLNALRTPNRGANTPTCSSAHSAARTAPQPGTTSTRPHQHSAEHRRPLRGNLTVGRPARGALKARRCHHRRHGGLCASRQPHPKTNAPCHYPSEQHPDSPRPRPQRRRRQLLISPPAQL